MIASEAQEKLNTL